MDDDASVALDAKQAAEQLPGCPLAALERQATALAAAGFEGSLAESLRYTDARELPRGHFAGEGAGLYARVRIARGQVLGLYCGLYELDKEAEEAQLQEFKPDPARVGPPRIFSHLFQLDMAELTVDALSADGARSWGGCFNAARRDDAGDESESEPNVVFLKGVRGAHVPGPELPGHRLPMLVGERKAHGASAHRGACRLRVPHSGVGHHSGAVHGVQPAAHGGGERAVAAPPGGAGGRGVAARQALAPLAGAHAGRQPGFAGRRRRGGARRLRRRALPRVAPGAAP